MLERVFYLVFNEKFINFVAICTKTRSRTCTFCVLHPYRYLLAFKEKKGKRNKKNERKTNATCCLKDAHVKSN